MPIAKNEYLFIFDELNVLLSELKSKKKDEDDIIDFLIDTYVWGFKLQKDIFDVELEINQDELYKSLNWEYDGESILTKAENYLATENYDDLKRLLDSEAHRSFNKGSNDYAVELSEATGLKLRKTWHTMGDEKVRDTHFYLDGVTIDLDAEFVTYDDDRALYPSGFNKASNNANCRCVLEYTIK